VQGVVVVCEGAGDIFVRQAVIDAVTTLCGIPANRVSVAKMGQ
jgi:stage III sporulation protein AG